MFSSAQAHFTEANNPHAKYIWTNINASLRGVVDKTMSGLEPLRVTERNAKPTIANPKVQILETNRCTEYTFLCSYAMDKTITCFYTEPVLSIRTCFQIVTPFMDYIYINTHNVRSLYYLEILKACFI